MSKERIAEEFAEIAFFGLRLEDGGGVENVPSQCGRERGGEEEEGVGGRAEEEGRGGGERGLGVMRGGRDDDVEEKRRGLRERGEETIERERTVLVISEMGHVNGFAAIGFCVEDALTIDSLRCVGRVDMRLEIADGGTWGENAVLRDERYVEGFHLVAPVLKNKDDRETELCRNERRVDCVEGRHGVGCARTRRTRTRSDGVSVEQICNRLRVVTSVVFPPRPEPKRQLVFSLIATCNEHVLHGRIRYLLLIHLFS